MLNFSILKTQMQSGFATHNNSANEAAGKIASAFDAYIKTIANQGNGTYANMPGVSTLRSTLTNIFNQQMASKLAISNNIAAAINTCFLTLMTTYQTAPPQPVGFDYLQTSLARTFGESQPSGQVFAQKFAGNIDGYVRKCMIKGVIPVTPPIVFDGPPK